MCGVGPGKVTLKMPLPPPAAARPGNPLTGVWAMGGLPPGRQLARLPGHLLKSLHRRHHVEGSGHPPRCRTRPEVVEDELRR